MTKIDTETRQRITILLREGHSLRQIQAITSFSHTTIRRIRNKTTPELQKNRGGRPAKLTEINKRYLLRQMARGQQDNASQLKVELKKYASIDVCNETIRRTLREGGLRPILKKKKPMLTPRHRRLRRELAQKYEHWTYDDWKHVIWSDETKINRFGSDGRKWVWKKCGTPLTDQHIEGTTKFGGGNLMMWGSMTSEGVGYSTKIDGRMDAALYVSILEGELQDTIDYYHLDGQKVIFQHDNDPKHTSKLAIKCLADHNMKVLQWPPQSPDLNPIEHLWDHLKRRLNSYEESPKGINELWVRVEKEWESIPKQTCIDLIQSMPRRIKEVIKANGGHTNY